MLLVKVISKELIMKGKRVEAKGITEPFVWLKLRYKLGS